MPEMGGLDVARIMQRDFPEVKVLFTSGFSRPMDNDEKAHSDGFIQKPFTASELSARIREVLDSQD